MKRSWIFGQPLWLLIVATTNVFAQTTSTINERGALTVTATASADRVRFAAPSAVIQIRLEVYNPAGEKIFDNEVRGGNVLDWIIQDGQGQLLPDDTYLCLIAVKSLAGRITERIGALVVSKGAASLRPAEVSQMTAQQSQAVGPIEENLSINILSTDEPQTPTVIAHNGEDGQITRGRGALSFRLDDFFRGTDTEQMRLTAEGNLGIGIRQPQARLDVDGFIRASQGIVFPDGSVQFSASRKTFGAASLKPGQFQQKSMAGQEHLSPDISGTGTTGKLSQWLDGPAGILGDSNITEASGAIGINATPDTRFRLDVNGSTRIRGSNPGFNLEGLRAAGNIWLFQTVDDDGRFRLFGQDNEHPGVEHLTIKLDTGNIGIGTPSPNTKLEVVNPTRQLRFGASTADNGGYLISTNPSQAIIAGGATWNGATWIARDTVASLTAHQNGVIQFFTDNIPSIGNQFSPTLRMQIDTNGNVGIGTAQSSAKLDVLRVDGTSFPAFNAKSLSSMGVRGVSGTENGSFVGGQVGVYGFSANVAGVYGHSLTGNAGYFKGRVTISDGLIIDNGGCTGCSPSSDRNLKANFANVDSRSILSRLARLPIQSWSYKSEPPNVQHIGPMAQDFRAVFGLGKDDKVINTVDADGVALAAIQALYQLVQDKEKKIERLQTRVARLERKSKKRRAGRQQTSR